MSEILTRLAEVLEARKGADPKSSYVAGLYAKGLDAILKKIGEEATETVMAAKDGAADKIVRETADLWFHTLVLLAQQGLHPNDVLAELERRFGLSGVSVLVWCFVVFVLVCWGFFCCVVGGVGVVFGVLVLFGCFSVVVV